MPVVEQRYEPRADIAALVEHPRNPRRGNDEGVARSIDRNGWYGAVIAQESTGYVLAGHTRRRALLSSGVSEAPVIFLDVDDETATAILLADNRTAELATWDDHELLDILNTLPDLSAAGFTDFDVEALMRKIEPIDPDPGEGDEPDIGSKATTCPKCGHSWQS